MGLVIGLCGSKGSGKDQFFKTVYNNFPFLDVRKIAYADPIKHEVMHIFDLINEEQYDLFKRNSLRYDLPGYLGNSVSGRSTVREIGMLMRRYDENQFTKYVEDTINAAPSSVCWCITDLRFENELDSIKNKLGGIIVKVNRAGFNYDGHITETEFSDDICDHVIQNSSTLEDYEIEIVSKMKSLLSPT